MSVRMIPAFASGQARLPMSASEVSFECRLLAICVSTPYQSGYLLPRTTVDGDHQQRQKRERDVGSEKSVDRSIKKEQNLLVTESLPSVKEPP